jgi:hypothetical protein
MSEYYSEATHIRARCAGPSLKTDCPGSRQVVIPMYDRAGYLPEALGSVLDRDWVRSRWLLPASRRCHRSAVARRSRFLRNCLKKRTYRSTLSRYPSIKTVP